MNREIDSICPPLIKALERFYADPVNAEKFRIWQQEREKEKAIAKVRRL